MPNFIAFGALLTMGEVFGLTRFCFWDCTSAKLMPADLDLVNSFAPIAMIGFADSALVVHPSLPVKTAPRW